jgi:hypothetical protein
VNSAPSSQWYENNAERTGRHRAPSRIRKSIKIITATAAVAGLAGGVAGYEVNSHPQPDPVAKTVANYHHERVSSQGVLAAGAELINPQHTAAAKGHDSGKISKISKSGQSDKTPAKTTTRHRARPAVKVTHVRRSRRAGHPPFPFNSSQGGGFNSSQGGGQGAAPAPTPIPSSSPSSSGSSSSSLKADVQKDIADGNYELAVGQYLVENGYSKAGAAGVVGCIDGESGGDPESVGSGGGGLIGWTPISSAAPNPNIITGNPATDMMTQLEDLLYYNASEIGQSMVDQLNAITDPVQAADFYSQNFEKPAVLDSDVRPSTAEQIYSELGG